MTRVGEVEQAVSRTLRDSLDRLQRTTEELNHAVTDLVSACGSARPTNSLPPMLRAQTAAASLAASLEVLSRFVTAALQPDMRTVLEREAAAQIRGLEGEEASEPFAGATAPEALVIDEPVLESQPVETAEQLAASDMEEEGAPVAAPEPPVVSEEPVGVAEMSDADPAPVLVPVSDEEPAVAVGELQPAVASFQITSLPPEEQELHKRASRVAKVSMQDIKMLRPKDVLLGKENKDICVRLRDDIEKAHKEYDRRFQTILGHPVDHFYDWMVEILGDGDPNTLGAYPYPSPVLRR